MQTLFYNFDIFLQIFSFSAQNVPQIERIGRIFFCFGQKRPKRIQKNVQNS